MTDTPCAFPDPGDRRPPPIGRLGPANENGTEDVDPVKLDALTERVLGDLGGALSVPLVHLGARLGLYRDLAAKGPATSQELARRTGLAERLLREWLAHQAASGYLAYEPATRRFALEAEQAMLFANENGPACLQGAFEMVLKLGELLPRCEQAFHGNSAAREGDDAAPIRAVERSFRPSCGTGLIEHWLPALDGVVERLRRGGRVAEIGCGDGTTSAAIAAAFPAAKVVGFDADASPIARARDLSRETGLPNLRFELADAQGYEGAFDLVVFLDCLHDRGDPVGAASYARRRLAEAGTCMVVEPFARDRLEDNFTTMGRIDYAASTLACVPAAMAQPGGQALGAQAGPARLLDVLRKAGFRSARVVAQSRFDLVLAAEA